MDSKLITYNYELKLDGVEESLVWNSAEDKWVDESLCDSPFSSDSLDDAISEAKRVERFSDQDVLIVKIKNVWQKEADGELVYDEGTTEEVILKTDYM